MLWSATVVQLKPPQEELTTLALKKDGFCV
jgi:hypothetical protein